MWPSVILLAFLSALDPVRLGIILLVISRPRPVQNLLAYGAGSLAACSYMVVLPLVALNSTPIDAYRQSNSTVHHVQIWAGLVALLFAAASVVRLLLRRPNTPKPRADREPALRRLLGRARAAWERGGLWTALVIGIGMGGPQWGAVALLLAVIAVSGAAVGAQVGAAVIFVAGLLAVVEITLIGHLVNPVKAEKVLRRLADWAWGHRQHVAAALSAVAGVSLLINGTGAVASLGR